MTRIPASALALLALIALFWGFNWPVLKIAVREAPIFWFRLVCVWGSALGLFAVARLSGQSLGMPRGERGRLVWVSLFSIVGWNAFTGFGVLLLPAGRASMLGYTMPLWLALLSHFMLGQRVRGREALALALGLGGVVLLISADMGAVTRVPTGTLCMLAAAVSWAMGVALIKQRPFSVAPTVQTAWMMTLGGIPLALFALMHRDPLVPTMSGAAWGAVAYNVVIAGVLCYWAFYKLVNLLPASITGISSLSVPVIGVLTGVLFLGESPGLRDWLALVLILMALFLVLIWPARKAGP